MTIEEQMKKAREILQKRGLNPITPSTPTTRISYGNNQTLSNSQAKKSVSGFGVNVLKSGGSFIKDTATGLANAFNPDSKKNTVANLGRVALGAAEKVIPGRQGAEDQFDSVVDFYKQRYGNVDSLKETLYNDPVGFAADLSTILGGAGAGLKAASAGGKVSSLSKAGKVATTVSKVTDPLQAVSATGRGISRAAKEALGTTTGAGFGAIKEGLEASIEGGARKQAFTSSLRSGGTGREILETANSALDDIFEQRRSKYVENLEKLQKDTYVTKNGQLYIRKTLEGKEATSTKGYTPGTKVLVPTKLTTQGIKQIATKSFKEIGIDASKGRIDFTKRPSLDAANLQKLSDLLYSWDDLSPVGLNQLKQEIEGFRKGGINLNPADKRFNYVVDRIGSGLKGYLEERVPQVKPLNETYSKQTQFINEIRKELSLGDGKSVDTGIRKLTSAMRQNNEFRLDLIKQLQQTAGKEITSSVAGTALNPLAPRGIIKPIIAGGGIVGGLTMGVILQALPFLALASPRIVGEFINALGTGTRIIKKTGLPKVTKPAAKAGFQIQRANLNAGQ